MKAKLHAFFEALQIVFVLIGLVWIVQVVNMGMENSLYVYGVLPRKVEGLAGILFHPFIHGNMQHLILNTLPLFVLGSFVATEGKVVFLKVTLIIIFTGGLLLWIFGRPSFHIGSSVLIFGYFGFIMVNVFYKKTFTAILISIITVILYGGLIYGILPINSYTSWEGHLFSMIAGGISAKLSHQKR